MHKENVNNFELVSSDGWNTVQFECHSLDSNYVLARITASGQFWNRQTDFDVGSSELVDDFCLDMFQAKLKKTSLSVLTDKLGLWIKSPEEIQVSLSNEDLPNVEIFIGQVEGLICSILKPAFVFHYRDSRIETQIKFIVDQSCIGLFHSGLKRMAKDFDD